ncbi:macrophage mannose receptor 1-like [Polypterus senegalus]|uniref:macrophage mannose receptor 1-like n=1 Tax=Polypterus senegalus TaxID=55291 RepID=UPI001963B2F3|nr:macrophage mannose receptor 1-like [Polypterus senegalus]
MNKNLSNWCTNSAWIGLRHEYDNWNWSNSDPVTYTNWKRTFSCAVLQSDGSWNDSDCNALNPFLCYNETDNSNGRFFWINISMTWSSAQNYCQVYYTDLASIRNESENNAAMEKIQNITSWIGLFNKPWKWSDGQDFTFQNWTLQQAKKYQNNEICVKVTNNGDWKAIDCSTQQPFICSEHFVQKKIKIRVNLQVQSGVNPEDPEVTDAILNQIKNDVLKQNMENITWQKTNGCIFTKQNN